MDRFKAQPNEEILLQGNLTYHKSKWSFVDCQGTLTSKRFVMGKKVPTAWGLIPMIFNYLKGKKIVFEIPLENFDSIIINKEELGNYFILKTTDGAEYPVNSSDLFSKNDKWIQTIAGAVRIASPDLRVKANMESLAILGAAGAATSANATSKRRIPLVALIGGLVVIASVAFLLNKNRTPIPPAGMVYVPGGQFTMGRNDTDEYERPAHKVTVRPFLIDIYEVTNEEYAACMLAGQCHSLPRDADHEWSYDENGKAIKFPVGTGRKPVTGIGWNNAEAYAAWKGKRLPTEEEWEFAARGTDGRRYPWGNEWSAGLANADGGSSGLTEVGTYKGVSPFGALDMVGNASEWTASKLSPYAGGSWTEVLVRVDLERLRSYNVTLDDLAAVFRAQKMEVQVTPAEQNVQELLLLARSIADPRILDDLVVATRNSFQIRVRDLGHIEIITNEGRRVVRGGAYRSTRAQATTTYRAGSYGKGNDLYPDTGFRCVKDVAD